MYVGKKRVPVGQRTHFTPLLLMSAFLFSCTTMKDDDADIARADTPGVDAATDFTSFQGVLSGRADHPASSVLTAMDHKGFPGVHVSEIPLQVVQQGDEVRLTVSSDDVIWANMPGEPQIPWAKATVVVPENANLKSVVGNLLSIEFKDFASGSVVATPPLSTWVDGKTIYDWKGKTNIAAGKDADIYTRDAFWPSVDYRILGTGKLRTHKIVTIAVPLAKLNPKTGEIKTLVTADLAIEYQTLEARPTKISNDLVGNKMLLRKVLNFRVNDLKSSAYITSPSTYAIITTTAIQAASSQLSSFITHKESLGFNVIVVTENDFGGGVGDDAAENIRAWLKDNYIDQNIEYVLLIGNPDPSSADVPMKMCWPRNNQEDNKEAPTDMYYAELTSETWDLDQDGYYGEEDDDFGVNEAGVTGIEYIADVYVGRIPYYGNAADLDAILVKTIDYETSSSVWRKNVLLAQEPLGPGQPAYLLGEAIKNDIAIPNNWFNVRVYDKEYDLPSPAEHIPCNEDNVVNAWVNNPAGLVVWYTHGWSMGASEIMDVPHVASLNDEYPSFTFQASCETAHPEEPNNLTYSLLKNGGVATIGATRVSWSGSETELAGSNSIPGMAYEYSRRIIEDNKTAGEAFYEMKDLQDDSNWMNKIVFNIYGDPSLAIVNNIPDDQNFTRHPYVRKPIPNQQVYYAQEPVLIDLYEYIFDLDDDRLSFLIETTNPDILRYSVTDGILSLDPKGPLGEGAIVVNFNDGKSRRGYEVFNVTVHDNIAPVVINPISDLRIQLGESMTVDISNVFADSDTSTLTYTLEKVFDERYPDYIDIEIVGNRIELGITSMGYDSCLFRETTDEITLFAHDGNNIIGTSFNVEGYREHNVPYVEHPIPDQTLTVGGPTFVIDDLDTVFADLDNNTLRYSIVDGNPNVATSTLIENALTVTPVSDGETMFVIFASDCDGSIMYDFHVTVLPDETECTVDSQCNDDDDCTDNRCIDGDCTYSDNGTCQGSGPCAGICDNPVLSNQNQNQSIGIGEICVERTATITGGNCGNFDGSRSLTVNGTQMACNWQNWHSIPSPIDGGYCIHITAGGFDYAGYSFW